MSTTEQPWYVYAHTVEGLFFKALRARITPSVEAQLKPLGIDLHAKPKEVPHAQWKEALRLAAGLFDGSPDEQYGSSGARCCCATKRR